MVKPSRTQSGFTLIEAMTGVMITVMVASSIMMGVSKAQSTLNSIRLKERAFEELKIYTDYWKSMVAAGKVTSTNTSGINGETVVLTKDLDGNPIVTGKLFRKIARAKDSGEFSIYYSVNTRIEWKDNTVGKEKPRRIEFKTKQMKFHI